MPRLSKAVSTLCEVLRRRVIRGLDQCAFFLCGILAITGTRIYKGETIKQVFCGGGGVKKDIEVKIPERGRAEEKWVMYATPLLDVAIGDDIDQERFFDHSDQHMEET